MAACGAFALGCLVVVLAKFDRVEATPNEAVGSAQSAPTSQPTGLEAPAPQGDQPALFTREVQLENQAVEPGSSDQEADLAGVTPEMRLSYLMNARDEMLKARAGAHIPESQKLTASFGFVQRCVAAVMHAQGRAEFPGEYESSTRRTRLTPSRRYELSFAADSAQYRFARGEFPCYDYLYDCVFGSLKEPAQPAQPDAVPTDLDQEIDRLFNQAMQTFDRRESAKQEENGK